MSNSSSPFPTPAAPPSMTAPAPSDSSDNSSHAHAGVRPAWLAQHSEAVIEPMLPIIDAHHHLWEFPEKRYRSEDYAADLDTGHNIRATVFVECKTQYRTDGPVEFQPVGEAEFALQEAHAAEALGAAPKVCAAIVAYADLSLGENVRPVLLDLAAATAGRLRGVRNVAVWHPDPTVRASAATPPAHLLLNPQFQQGFTQLAPLDLSFDAWLIHTQLDELCILAQTFPDTRIAVNHIGGPLALGPYRSQRDAVFQDWQQRLRRLAHCDNVFMKIGGFGMPWFGSDFFREAAPPDSIRLASVIEPYVQTCIEIFGPERCMFESNFPVDKGNFSYTVLWNAFKRITAGASASDRAALFHDTAASFYGIDVG